MSCRERDSGRSAPAVPFPQTNKLQLCHFDRPACQSEAAGKEGEISLQKPLTKLIKRNEKAFFSINLNSHINRKIQFTENQFLTPHLEGFNLNF